MKQATVVRRTPNAAAVALSSAAPARLVSTAPSKDAEPASLIKYGTDNRLPNYLLGLIGESSTANRCFDKRAKFIEADGFQDRTLSKTEIVPGSGKTFDTLWHDTSKRLADLTGIAWAVYYDREGGLLDTKVLPFSCVRKRAGGDFILNYGYMDGKKGEPKRTDDIFFFAWEPDLTPEKLKEQFDFLEHPDNKHLGYNGHMFYKFDADPDLFSYYPLPQWYSNGTVADIEADAAASLLDKKNISQGFMAGVHVHATGQQYLDIQTGVNDDGIPVLETSPNTKALMETISDLKGSNTDATALFTVGAVADEKVTVTMLDTGKAYQGMTDVSDRVAFKVCKGLGVNPILIGLTVSGRLGTSQELREAARQLADEVTSEQNLASRAFAEVFGKYFPGANWDLSSLAPKRELPENLFQYLDETQKKSYLSQFI